MKRSVLVSLFSVALTTLFALASWASEFGFLYEGTFPPGTIVLPMNGTQPSAGRVPAFGLAHRVLRDGGDIFRIIQGPTDTAFMKTNLSPQGREFFGGPILVLPQHANIIKAAQLAQFPDVQIETLTEAFASQAIFPSFQPLNIAIIKPHADQFWHGRTDLLLDRMRIPYTIITAETVESNPAIIFGYDLVVVDCPGWDTRPEIPANVKQALQVFAFEGGELIFTHRGLRDLDRCFPGKVTVFGDFETIKPFNFYNNGDFLTQYFGPTTVPIYTFGGGLLAGPPKSPTVKLAVECPIYYCDTPGDECNAYGAFYFKHGKGIVECFGYHPHEQIPLGLDSEYAAAALYGNKFIEGKPIPRINLIPLTAVNNIGEPHTVTATVFDVIDQPRPNTEVRIKIISGPNAGLSFEGVTNQSGKLSWTYTSNQTGTDIIVAEFLEPSEETLYVSNECSKTWIVRPKNPGQAYPADSNGANRSFKGYLGLGDDVITAMGGVFSLVPGPNWSNFVKAAQLDIPYSIKNVVLEKSTPQTNQCSDVFPKKTIYQRGTPSIRKWWPLLYEIPGTKWTLTIVYGTQNAVQLNDEPSPRYVHTEKWEWTTDIDLADVSRFIDAVHELPWNTSQVPLISDESLYLDLKAMLGRIQTAIDSNNINEAIMLLGEFEMLVMDSCRDEPPTRPSPYGIANGIAQTECHPVCCKLLVDAEYILNKLLKK